MIFRREMKTIAYKSQKLIFQDVTRTSSYVRLMLEISKTLIARSKDVSHLPIQVQKTLFTNEVYKLFTKFNLQGQWIF